MNLLNLQPGEKALIAKVKGRGAFRKRITEMGFVAGKEVEVIRKAPLQDPVEYEVMGYKVSLRNGEASLIEIVTGSAVQQENANNYSGTFTSEPETEPAVRLQKTIHVALVGNPNSGKTTLYNHASGSSEKVANYSGVTVDLKEARFSQDGYEFIITDLPGTYSITAYSPEEIYVRNFILERMPDVVVNVVDAGNLERNLYLTTQLIDMDIQVVVALNMYDELQKSGDILDHDLLGEMLGIPFMPTVAARGKGIVKLFRKIIEVYEGRDQVSRHIHINYGNAIESAIQAVQEPIRSVGNAGLLTRISSRYLAIKLLDKDNTAIDTARSFPNGEEILRESRIQAGRLEKDFSEESETLITDAKYGFIAGALAETLKPNPALRRRKTEIIDTFITHRFLGIPVFFLIMWVIFFGTFRIGQYPMNGIEWLVQAASDTLLANLGEGILRDFLVQGIIGGVGGVIIFLPNIMLLYLFISLLEDSGYMARAVFIMDKAMHKIGLHGKSFIPMLMGFGCNVPAVLSTRVIESRRDRLITMFITPFMSCSARLPVYILFISAFFPRYQGTILFGMYFTGIIIAVGSALLLKKTVFRKKDVPFVMELPPYRIPTLRSVLRHMWQKAVQYLQKIGGVILTASVIIWALGYFPKSQDTQSENTQHFLVPRQDSVEVQHAQQQANSYIGRIGRFIQPVMAPLGFDWKLSVAILTGVSAKEVVVGTLGVLYHADDSGDGATLVKKLQDQKHTEGSKAGQPLFTPLIALSFMLFILIYFPCIGVVSAIAKESGSWKWALFIAGYTTVLAYAVSFTVFQAGSLLYL